MPLSLRARLLTSLCTVAVVSTGLVLVLQHRSLSADLKARAGERFAASAAAVERLSDHRLAFLRRSYEAVAARPQVRAVVETGDAPTLAYLANTLRTSQGAIRLLFLDPEGKLVAGAGDERLDPVLLSGSGDQFVGFDGRPYAVVSIPLWGGSMPLGSLVSADHLPDVELESWSAISGAQVVFDSKTASNPDNADYARLDVLDLGAWKLYVQTPRILPSDRAALSSSRRNLSTAGLIALMVAFAGGLVLSAGLTRPIRELGLAAERIGAGDFDVCLETARSDEIGVVAKTFKLMSTNLKTAIVAVTESADTVESTAGQIAALTGAVAVATTDQAREAREASAIIDRISGQVEGIAVAANGSAEVLRNSVEGSSTAAKGLLALGVGLGKNADILCNQADEVASAMSEMAVSSAQVADSAEVVSANSEASALAVKEVARETAEVDRCADESSRVSARMVEIADRGREKAQSTVDGMDAIQRATEKADVAISALGDRVGEISAIVGLIESITDEANLLALNSAIVAAQAGEGGRAFAVVAGQIKALARRVFAETGKIEKVVRAVEQESHNALSAIGSSAGSVGTGVELAAEAGAALDAITQAASVNSQHMDDVLAATKIQNEASTNALAKIKITNSALAEIRAACSEHATTTDALSRGSLVLVEAAREVLVTTEQQGRESARMVDVVEAVRSEVDQTSCALREQSAALADAGAGLTGANRLADANRRADANQESILQVEKAVRGLLERAECLRHDIRQLHR